MGTQAWTGHPWFDAIEREPEACAYSRSFNCAPPQYVAGTRVVTNADGSVTNTTISEDGTQIVTTTNPDGSTTMQIINPDGTITVKTVNADGTITIAIQNPDGSTTYRTQNPDGSFTVETVNADGSITVETVNADGTITVEIRNPDGSISYETINPDGSKSIRTVSADGTVTETVVTADGIALTTVTDPCGRTSKTLTGPDGGPVDWSAWYKSSNGANGTNGTNGTGIDIVDGDMSMGGFKYDASAMVGGGTNIPTVDNPFANMFADFNFDLAGEEDVDFSIPLPPCPPGFPDCHGSADAEDAPEPTPPPLEYKGYDVGDRSGVTETSAQNDKANKGMADPKVESDEVTSTTEGPTNPHPVGPVVARFAQLNKAFPSSNANPILAPQNIAAPQPTHKVN